MSEFRIMLDGGAVLVVDLHVEEPEEIEADPTSVGQALLNALGIGRPVAQRAATAQAPRQTRRNRPQPPPEPTAEEWLEQTSREALRSMRSG